MKKKFIIYRVKIQFVYFGSYGYLKSVLNSYIYKS